MNDPICKHCQQAAPVDPRFETPLCAPCRKKLAGRGFPWPIWLCAFVVLGFVGVGFQRFRALIPAAKQLSAAKHLANTGDHRMAAVAYRELAKEFPKSSRMKISLVKELFLSAQIQPAYQALNSLNGTSLSKYDVAAIRRAEKEALDKHELNYE